MSKDIFEIAIGEQLRSAQANVPAGTWTAIQSGMNKGAGGSSAAGGTSFGMGFGIAAGTALLVSLATYSEMRTPHQEGAMVGHTEHAETVSSEPASTISMEDAEQMQNWETTTAVANDEIRADIVVVEKTPSSVVVNEMPSRIETREELESLEPAVSVASNDVQVSSNMEEATIAVNNTEAEASGTKTKDIPQGQVEMPALEELPEPVDAIISASEIFGYAPMTVKFDNLGNGADHAWDFGKFGSSYEKSPELTFDEPGVYTVYLNVSNETGADVVSDAIQVTVKEGSHLYYPNAITPNGDGMNDRYEIDGYLIDSFLMIITNEKGDIIFQTRDVNQGWTFDQSIHDLNGTKYFVTYKATGVDGKVYAKDRMPLNIIL